MLAYVVERVYQDQRPSSVMSVFSSPERAQTWIERQQFPDTDQSFVHVRVIEVDVNAAAAS
ncbi:MAG: hypothetical protein U0Q03_12000 [Acidimicrobiales bacterium]